MEKVDTSVRSEQKGTPMTDTTSNTAVLDTEFAGLETRDAHAGSANITHLPECRCSSLRAV